jgi:AbiU2
MTAISARVVEEFCALCDSAYQASFVHRQLFDDNPDADRICASRFGHGYAKLSEITQEHALLCIAKLHDPAVMAGKITLSISYMLTYGGWSTERQVELAALAQELDRFATKLKSARNQTLAHNDLAAILAGGVLGAFNQDEDVGYFDTLQKFADIARREVTGRAFSYTQHAAGGISAIATALSRMVDA